MIVLVCTAIATMLSVPILSYHKPVENSSTTKAVVQQAKKAEIKKNFAA